MPVAAFTAFGLVKFVHFNELRLLMTGNHHLGNALTIVHYKGLIRQVDEHHANLAAIVGIDGAGRVEHGKPVLQGQSAAGTYLCLIACGQCNVQSGGYEFALQRLQLYWLSEIGSQVETCTERCGIGR